MWDDVGRRETRGRTPGSEAIVSAGPGRSSEGAPRPQEEGAVSSLCRGRPGAAA